MCKSHGLLMIGLPDGGLQKNHLTGAVPSSLCSIQDTEGVNALTADCARTNTIGDPTGGLLSPFLWYDVVLRFATPRSTPTRNKVDAVRSDMRLSQADGSEDIDFYLLTLKSLLRCSIFMYASKTKTERKDSAFHALVGKANYP